MSYVRKFFIALAMICITPVLLAEELSEKSIQQWLKAMPSLTGWLHQHQDALHSEHIMEESSDMDQVFAKSIKLLREKGLYADFNSLVRKQGYQDVEQWSEVSRDISLAFIALQMDQEQITVAQLEEQLAKLESAEGISAEQKAMMTEMMQTSLMMLKSTQGVSQNNKQLVRQYAAQIERQFNAETEGGEPESAAHDHHH